MNNDLISRSALKSYIDCGHLRPPTEKCRSELDVVRMLDRQPGVDAEPVRHGEWILLGRGWDFYYHTTDVVFRCSECGLRATKRYPYCHCGAKMDGDTNAAD